MSGLVLIKKPKIAMVKGYVILDRGVNLLIKKKRRIYDFKHKTYLQKSKKMLIRKKENSTAKVGDFITVISCRKLSPTIYFKEL